MKTREQVIGQLALAMEYSQGKELEDAMIVPLGIVGDVLRLLKGEEAALLKLEGLKRADTGSGVLWLETPTHLDACRYAGEQEVFGSPYMVLNTLERSHVIKCPEATYGRSWRVWTAEPDREQRRKAAWK